MRRGTVPYLAQTVRARCRLTGRGQSGLPIVLSTQHDEDYNGAPLTNEQLRADIRREVIDRIVPADMVDAETAYHINPTGKFVIGGPQGDCGLTGRKIIVDTYGGMGRHGGGAFSGKDPSKVDRSAAYMARYVAKNIVAAGLAEKAEVQLAYAIGVAEPVSVYVETFGTGRVDPDRMSELVRAHFPLKPRGIIEHLQLLRPIFRQSAAYGHFGREIEDFIWERTDKAAALKEAAGFEQY